MTGVPIETAEAAARWHLASVRDDMDWDGFTAWLEADPSHRSVYDEIALADELAGRCPPEALPEPAAADAESAPPRSRWPLWAGGALAATLAALLIIPQVNGPRTVTYLAGRDARTIALADGSRIILAPSSRLTASGAGAQELTLEGGALFDIRHDPRRVMTIRAGGIEVADIGTRFEIQATPGAVRVEVGEGAVRIAGDALAAPVRLAAGKRFAFDRTHARATISAVSRTDVGEWREGRLTFDDAPLTLVAEDLLRYADAKMVLSPALAERRFSGTLSIRDGDAAIRDVAQIMGLRLVRDGGPVRLEP
jgi:transmembrane sensor